MKKTITLENRKEDMLVCEISLNYEVVCCPAFLTAAFLVLVDFIIERTGEFMPILGGSNQRKS
jgi:hypothetical protein